MKLILFSVSSGQLSIDDQLDSESDGVSLSGESNAYLVVL